jgi:endonuclease III
MLQALNEQIRAADRRLEEIVRADEVVRRLCSVPGVGPVVATTFAATLDEASRFMGAKHVRRTRCTMSVCPWRVAATDKTLDTNRRFIESRSWSHTSACKPRLHPHLSITVELAVCDRGLAS